MPDETKGVLVAERNPRASLKRRHFAIWDVPIPRIECEYKARAAAVGDASLYGKDIIFQDRSRQEDL
jgi:hypothetical protein